MIDHCFWCGVNKCQNSHGQEMVNYRLALHQRALDLLEGKITPFLEALVYKRQVDALFNRHRDQLTMREHRMKGLYKKFSTHMDGDEAYLAAKKVAKKMESQSSLLYMPKFSAKEKANLAAWKPRWNENETL